ncbi:AraC family transcriptional regulator [Lachnospiraceae bacterium OttesenSCG-928-D06]|nr:AraC family transcriptional regulator [Lachnospiraceae bacterium OttesenSCG-928-D06]
MFFQKDFQHGDFRVENHISCQPYFVAADRPCPLHCHSYYEISYIFKGKRIQEYGGKRYEALDNTLFFVPPLLIHGYSNIEETQDVVIQFTSNFLKNISPSITENLNLDIAVNEPCVEFEGDYMEELRSFCNRKNAIKHSGENVINKQELFQIELSINSLVTKLLSQLMERGYIHLVESTFDNDDCLAFDEIINDILLYPNEIPSMEEAARKSGLSYFTFSRRFKAATGFNYSEYCNILKIQYAENLLLNTTMPVSEVAGAVGITTFSYFSRLFKNVNGLTPTAFRQQYK